jgi:Cu/Zn superoxide dismutase
LKRVISILVVSVSVAGCSSTSSIFSSRQPAAGPSPGLVANLQGIGSSVSGKVRVIDRGDGVTVMVSAINLPIGEYRVSFNENRNCTSPNGFSAGPPWAPPGMNPRTLIPSFTNGDGNSESEAHVSGVRVSGENGIVNRSVVLYWGRTVTDAEPDVPNNRIACGVFEPVQPFAF